MKRNEVERTHRSAVLFILASPHLEGCDGSPCVCGKEQAVQLMSAGKVTTSERLALRYKVNQQVKRMRWKCVSISLVLGALLTTLGWMWHGYKHGEIHIELFKNARTEVEQDLHNQMADACVGWFTDPRFPYRERAIVVCKAPRFLAAKLEERRRQNGS